MKGSRMNVENVCGAPRAPLNNLVTMTFYNNIANNRIILC